MTSKTMFRPSFLLSKGRDIDRNFHRKSVSFLTKYKPFFGVNFPLNLLSGRI